VEVLNDFKSYRVVCYSKAEQESVSEEISNFNVELLMDHLRELKAHEDEIRKVRQELETQVQRHWMHKRIALELCE
jgi:hypothetical protein